MVDAIKVRINYQIKERSCQVMNEPDNRQSSIVNQQSNLVAGDAYPEWLGIEIIEARGGYSRAEIVVQPQMVNGLGILHGGLIFSLADTALAYASNGHGLRAVATSVTIHFIRAIQRTGVRLVAIAQEDNLTEQRGLYDIRVTEAGDGGRLIAAARGAVFRQT